MIDEFTIFNKGGAVLWSRRSGATKGRPIDELVQTVLLEERGGESSYNINPYTLKWTFANELDLVRDCSSSCPFLAHNHNGPALLMVAPAIFGCRFSWRSTSTSLSSSTLTICWRL